MARPYCVGLTGGIGAGKSTVAELFARLGVAVIDADAIAHELTRAGGAAMPDIAAALGAGVIGAGGALDRAAMRELAFRDAGARATLEGILHPMIRDAAARALAVAAPPYALLVVPLLAERFAAYRGLVDRVLVVDCDAEQQIERASRRPGMSREQALAVMAAQADRASRLSLADDVISNRGDMAMLAAGVERLHRAYLAQAAGQTSAGRNNSLP